MRYDSVTKSRVTGNLQVRRGPLSVYRKGVVCTVLFKCSERIVVRIERLAVQHRWVKRIMEHLVQIRCKLYSQVRNTVVTGD